MYKFQFKSFKGQISSFVEHTYAKISIMIERLDCYNIVIQSYVIAQEFLFSGLVFVVVIFENIYLHKTVVE
jgi:hypothetical protein